MSLFSNILRDDESLFINAIALDYDFQPKVVLYREEKQQHIARSIAPILQGRNGRNLLITGKPGVGKTVCAKHVLRELEEEYGDDVFTLYINCWKTDTPFKIICSLCEQVGYTWTHNKRVDELAQALAKVLNKKAAVIVFDEADKLEDEKVLYTLLEDIYRKSLLLITNDMEYLAYMDERVKSRLTPDQMVFEPYTGAQTRGILEQRKQFAFVPNIWQEAAFDKVVETTVQIQDIRTGLFLLRKAADIAEVKASRIITEAFAEEAIKHLDHFKKNNPDQLEDEQKTILDLIKEHSGKTTKTLFKVYEDKGGKKSYRTFHRYLKELQKASMISLQEENKGHEGRSTIVKYTSIKRLGDFS